MLRQKVRSLIGLAASSDNEGTLLAFTGFKWPTMCFTGEVMLDKPEEPFMLGHDASLGGCTCLY
jgi:hypothetical protein